MLLRCSDAVAALSTQNPSGDYTWPRRDMNVEDCDGSTQANSEEDLW